VDPPRGRRIARARGNEIERAAYAADAAGAEAHTSRALITQSWRLVLDGWPAADAVDLPVGPAASLTSVTAYDADDAANALDPRQFALDGNAQPARLLLPERIGGMPVLRRHQGIEIDYAAGYGDAADDVPTDLRQAILVLVGHWFENRDAALDSGRAVPASFERLAGPYRRVRL
jgi:uncharacterized phiE125 gp8 family phage protein